MDKTKTARESRKLALSRARVIYSMIYPVILAICAVIMLFKNEALATIGVASFVVISIVTAMLCPRECFYANIMFTYPLLFIVQRSVETVILIPLCLFLSALICFLRFFLSPSFAKDFIKKGLLFYGIAFFVLALICGGAFTSNHLGTLLLLSPLFISLPLIYHASMALGNNTRYLQWCGVVLGSLSAFLGAMRPDFLIFTLIGILSALWLTVKTKAKLLFGAVSALLTASFVINILGGKADLLPSAENIPHFPNENWLFGDGIFGFAHSTIPFFAVITALGLFGLLALLTHMKHTLELFIRHISVEKTLLLLTPTLILFLPVHNGILLFALCLIYMLFASAAEHSLEETRRKRIDNVKPLVEGRRPRVLFPFIEAGKGHVTPEAAVLKVFKEKYGDVTEIVESRFYSETGDPDMELTEKLFAKAVQTQNKNHILSLLCRTGNFLAGDTFALYVLMAMTISGRKSIKPAKAHLEELDADVVFCTHWSIPFYISQSKKPHPYSIMFCPDVRSNGMFNVDCNLFLMPMEEGHREILGHRMYSGGNSAKVDFPVREEAYQFLGKREELRRELGIPDDEFVVTLCDGGYGMANLEKTLGYLLKSKQKMTLIALCGTNTELYERLSALKTPENITLMPQSFTPRVLEFLALSDLFVGKSGANSMAEPAFFGVPIIVTKCITYIERHIKDHYVKELGGALFIPSPKRAARKIIAFAEKPERLEPYKAALAGFRDECGAEEMADMIYAAVQKMKS